MDTVEQRVGRGAAWLDAVYPEWWTRIDLGTLDLAHGCRCVLGQLFGTEQHPNGYATVANHAPDDFDNEDVFWTVVHGFLGSSRMDEVALDEAWIAEVKARWEAGV